MAGTNDLGPVCFSLLSDVFTLGYWDHSITTHFLSATTPILHTRTSVPMSFVSLTRHHSHPRPLHYLSLIVNLPFPSSLPISRLRFLECFLFGAAQ